jgi:hypothetical protein
MATNVKVTKGKKDNNANLIKKFTRRMQESGVIPRVKSIRYSERSLSPFVKKDKRLKSIKNKAEFEEQVKLGKKSPRGERGRRR